MKTIPFTAPQVQNDTVATIADLFVDPASCQGAVLYHHNGRVMSLPAGGSPILARSRAKERALVELYLPLGSSN